MKKSIIFIVVIAIIFIVVHCFFIKRVETSRFSKGKVVFKYDKTDVYEPLAIEDVELLKELIENKYLYKDSPSCGFSENISVVFEETEVFSIACDGCPIVYYQNKDRYFKLSKAENEELKTILLKYNFSFPCL